MVKSRGGSGFCHRCPGFKKSVCVAPVAPTVLPGPSHWAFNKDPGKDCEFLLGWVTLGATGGVVFTERGGGTGPHPPGWQDSSVQTAVPAEVPHLSTPTDLVWKGVASCIFRGVSHLGLDTALFLTDFKFQKKHSLHTVHKKTLYRTCVRVLNKKTAGPEHPAYGQKNWEKLLRTGG